MQSWSDSTKDSAIIGTVDECVAQLKEHLAAGVQKLIFVPYQYDMRQIEIIANRDYPAAQSIPKVMRAPQRSCCSAQTRATQGYFYRAGIGTFLLGVGMRVLAA